MRASWEPSPPAPPPSAPPSIWHYFIDRHDDAEQKDYFAPVMLGVMELAAFPIFLRGDALEPIGAWIALKTLPQWKAWTDNRQRFNRFLVGQGLILVFAYLLSLFVSVAPSNWLIDWVNDCCTALRDGLSSGT